MRLRVEAISAIMHGQCDFTGMASVVLSVELLKDNAHVKMVCIEIWR
jgi:hypothetical protein